MTTPLYLHGAELRVEAGSLEQLGALVSARLPGHRVAVLIDQQLIPHYGESALRSFGTERPILLPVPTGERHKTRESWAALSDALVQQGFGRDTVIVAVGGGVTGDLAGFVAATYLRGVPFVQVPTSLLAMIDASIGGKTGVDTPDGKNLIGAFHQPALVLIDPGLLRTLPAPQLRAGLAEAIKHGVIADPAYFGWIASSLRELLSTDERDDETALRLVRRSVEIKIAVVEEDEREGGRRKILNFGHTVGHALEHATGYTLLHGEAVAIGMVAEARIAELLGLASLGIAETISTVCDAAGLPVALPEGLDPTVILDATRTDKKARGGQVEYALPCAIGAMAGAEHRWALPVPDSIVLESLSQLRKL